MDQILERTEGTRLSRQKVITFFAASALFLFGSLIFATKSGYSLGPVMLVLMSLFLISPSCRKELYQDQQNRLLIGVMIVFALVWAGGFWADSEPHSRAFDKPLRALLAIPVLWLLLVVKPSPKWLAFGILAGALSAGGIGIYEKLILGAYRADGPLHPIQFGNLSMLWAVFCAVVVCYLAHQAVLNLKQCLMLFLFILGAVAGVLGSLLSGSRGGWIGIPFVLMVFWRAYGGYFTWRVKGSFMALLAVAALGVWNTPQLGVQPRIEKAVTQFSGYVFDGTHQRTSVGQRLQMWENTLIMAAEKPVLGWGEQGYREYIFAAAKDGRLTPGIQHQHAHNQFLDMLAKHGVPGFLAVIAFFFVPLMLFGRHLKSELAKHKALAVAGTLLCVAFIDFGLTQAIIWHTGGMMVYSFMLVIIWALMKNEQYRGNTGAV